MSITEKAAYLKGLAEGLEIDGSTKEGKLLLALVDAVEEMADEVADLQEVCEELDEVVDVLDEDLSVLEQVIDMDDDDCGCGHDHDDDDQDDDLYEVVCPSCDNTVYLDGGMIEEGSIDCPGCGEHLEFELDDEDEDTED